MKKYFSTRGPSVARRVGDRVARPASYAVSQHAARRMTRRRVSPASIQVAFAIGRRVHTRGAVIWVIGHKEAERARAAGYDADRLEGLHVVCSFDGTILTVYRTQDLRRLRPRH